MATYHIYPLATVCIYTVVTVLEYHKNPYNPLSQWQGLIAIAGVSEHRQEGE